MVTGSGTSSDPYMLYDLSDLEQIPTLGLSKYYKLANDIDASATQDESYNSGKGWNPIGTFNGNFNGNNKSIKGLYINRPTMDNVGFFGVIQYCLIYDVTIDEDDNGNGSIIGKSHVGGLVGYVYDRTPVLTNCTVKLDVTGTSYVGGVIGYIYRDYSMYSCHYSGTITSTGNYTGGVVGGIARITADSRPMNKCTATGVINAGGSYVGGIVGDGYYTLFSEITVTNELTINTISTSDYVGGICGRSYNHCYFYNCISKVNVSGRDYVGGICGSASNYNGGQFVECYSMGDIIGRSYIGGIVGKEYGSDARSYIQTCYSVGNITSNGSYCGGIAGYCTRPVTNCYSMSSINGSDSSGGLIGRMESNTITNCYSKGSVTGSTNIGGLVGYKNTGTETSCYWDTQTSGQVSSALGTGKTTAEMKTESTYTSWDFSTPIWVIDSNGIDNSGYPYLSYIKYFHAAYTTAQSFLAKVTFSTSAAAVYIYSNLASAYSLSAKVVRNISLKSTLNTTQSFLAKISRLIYMESVLNTTQLFITKISRLIHIQTINSLTQTFTATLSRTIQLKATLNAVQSLTAKLSRLYHVSAVFEANVTLNAVLHYYNLVKELTLTIRGKVGNINFNSIISNRLQATHKQDYNLSLKEKITNKIESTGKKLYKTIVTKK